MRLKSSQNKKDQKHFQLHSFRCHFLQLAAEKITPETLHLEIFFGPSFFETALGNLTISLVGIRQGLMTTKS